MTAKDDATLILHVNLECEKCYMKIQKLLCELQSKEDISKIDYENSKNRVTISCHFDPVKLAKKLRCKACHAIKDIEIKPKQDEENPEDNKTAKQKKEEKVDKKAAGAGPTTVNLQFTNICSICYPWPCSEPAHWGGLHRPQQLPCGGVAPLPAPGHLQHPQKWAPCGGPSFCGGCVSCHGGGGGVNCWQPPQPQPMRCPGPSLCRGCNGCKIVRESKFSYEEYPSISCVIM